MNEEREESFLIRLSEYIQVDILIISLREMI